jgi:hypothetical protein
MTMNTSKKLALKTESLRSLDSADMTRVNGGFEAPTGGGWFELLAPNWLRRKKPVMTSGGFGSFSGG